MKVVKATTAAQLHSVLEANPGGDLMVLAPDSDEILTAWREAHPGMGYIEGAWVDEWPSRLPAGGGGWPMPVACAYIAARTTPEDAPRVRALLEGHRTVSDVTSGVRALLVGALLVANGGSKPAQWGPLCRVCGEGNLLSAPHGLPGYVEPFNNPGVNGVMCLQCAVRQVVGVDAIVHTPGRSVRVVRRREAV